MPLTDLGSMRLHIAVLETGVLSPDCDRRVDSEVDVEVPNSMPKPILFQVLHPQPTSDT